MSDVSLRTLLEAGVHFGHQTQRWNPKMKKYIFMERSGIYILDLQKTLSLVEKARSMTREVVKGGGCVLFVGTKKQAQDTIRDMAIDCGQHYVTERWLGGMLTNFQTVRKSIARLKDLESMAADSSYESLAKKERLGLDKERMKLDKVFCGIKDMDRTPSAIFIVDTQREKIALSEAIKLGIPVVGIVDTNCDPTGVSHPIPGNDDAIRSIQLLTGAIASAVKEGSAHAKEEAGKREKEAAEKASEAADAAKKHLASADKVDTTEKAPAPKPESGTSQEAPTAAGE
ncbi:MAG: 30S ribosomal protein S2 [Gemmatimonadota bacterium]|nr:30S ribosomal protein S2 [Gemmatimonadota bacterium]MDP6528858.1 30S ribosomal protein S2 [Gemmatimonadota bacterium]MDP6802412.1 30S ribosomal protein S2 [Gemmatimonadota bacterium]MDP7031073.1 30S ribosomal protein S2 [Gemmatimonadota bacterium]